MNSISPSQEGRVRKVERLLMQRRLAAPLLVGPLSRARHRGLRWESLEDVIVPCAGEGKVDKVSHYELSRCCTMRPRTTITR